MFRRSVLLVLAICALVFAANAGATAGPIGPLPPGPTTNISTPAGSLVSVVLPKGAQGRGWRQAGTINQKVLREVNEANVGPNVVIVFKTVGKGTAKAVYALTKGETSKAYASSTFVITVR
jgi:hypothetical protein